MSGFNSRTKVSRRTFLMGALATATAPAFFSARPGFASGPNETLQLACIGLGRQGRTDMRELILRGLDENARLVAVCDVDSKRLMDGKELADKLYTEYAAEAGAYPGCDTYSDYKELLARKDIDGVLVVTPDHQHAVVAMAALRSGKDLYLEKPMTYSINEGIQLRKAMLDTGAVIQIGTQQRSSVYFRRACELVRNGFIGNLQTIIVTLPEDTGRGEDRKEPVPENLDYDAWSGPAEMEPYTEHRVHPQEGFGRPGWIQIERYCLGMCTGWGAHMNDIAQWGNGTDDTGPVELEATAEFPERGIFDVHTKFQAEGKYANGVKLVQKTGSPGVRFEGDEGWVFISREELKTSDPKLQKKKITSGIRLYESKNHMANFLHCMRSRRKPISDFETGHRANTMSIMTHIAFKHGKKLRWDPKKEKFLDDDKANAMLDYPHRKGWELA